jgi:hypothetical protein
MFMDLLIIFIILSIIFFILSIFTMEDTPMLSIPFIMVGMIFAIICTYGLWDVEIIYTNFNATTGFTNTSIYSTGSYGDPYGYIFVLFFFIFCVLFVRAGFNMWQDALRVQGELDYKKKSRRY